MSLRQLSARIELSFWQIVISLLSESRPVQQLVRWTYYELNPRVQTLIGQIDKKRAIRWAGTGLASGLLTGFLISTFR